MAETGGQERDDSPTFRLARDILAGEGMAPDDAGSAAEACANVLDGLYRKFRPMVGNGGFEAILGRALLLSGRRHPGIASLALPQAGPPSRDALRSALLEADTDGARAATDLLGEFLAFGGYLIGWSITLVILRGLWPDIVADYDPEKLREAPETTTPPRRPHKGER